MKHAFVARGVSRSIAWRLAAGVLPSVLAVGLVGGLFYYGEYGRAAPRLILIAAALLTVGSITIAWFNATYFADRLARLARATEHASGVRGPTDEFDRIEQAVGTLGSALSAAEAARDRSDKLATARLKEQATMLAGVVNDSIALLDQVRLPLQILLESPFGELNENQEELLRDARGAADSIDVALRRLGQVADVDRDAFQVQRELVQINDVVRAVLPIARAAAERRDARIEAALEPGLPRVLADRARLAEALSLLVADSAEETSAEASLSVATLREPSRAVIRIAPASPRVRAIAKDSFEIANPVTESASGNGVALAAPLVLAFRLIAAQGGAISIENEAICVRVGG